MIVVANQKGGVGKSTTSVNLAIGLAQAGQRTLLVDMDPQGNASFALLGSKELASTTYDLLVNEYGASDVIIPTQHSLLSLIPTDINLAGAEVELQTQPGGWTKLQERFEDTSVLAGFDYVVIDTPPSLGLLTINALAAADEIIIPVSASIFALKGIEQLEKTIARVQKSLKRPDLRIGGILCTMADHTNVARDVLSAIQKRFGSLVFTTVIPKNIKLEEAHSRATSVYEYAPESRGAEAYAAFVDEVLAQAEEVVIHGRR